jgi:hypothetical protein
VIGVCGLDVCVAFGVTAVAGLWMRLAACKQQRSLFVAFVFVLQQTDRNVAMGMISSHLRVA